MRQLSVRMSDRLCQLAVDSPAVSRRVNAETARQDMARVTLQADRVVEPKDSQTSLRLGAYDGEISLEGSPNVLVDSRFGVRVADKFRL